MTRSARVHISGLGPDESETAPGAVDAPVPPFEFYTSTIEPSASGFALAAILEASLEHVTREADAPTCPHAYVHLWDLRKCDKCGADMQLKTGRFGKYFGCTNSECTNTRKLLRSGEAAPPKMDPVPMPELQCAKVEDHFVLRDGASGIFLAASQFPKHRETRPPFVDELLPHQAEIDPKYHFLFDAPRVDDHGNRSQIRYSRKTKEQYVMLSLIHI